MLKKSNNLHSTNFASGTLTPSFGHGCAINKQEQGCTLAEQTLWKYLDRAENQGIKQNFTLGRKPKLTFFGLHHWCEGVQGGMSCSPLLTLDSYYTHLLSKGALANTNKSNWSCIDTSLVHFFKQLQLFTSSSF